MNSSFTCLLSVLVLVKGDKYMDNDEELLDTLIAISVVAKKLAQDLEKLKENENEKNSKENLH